MKNQKHPRDVNLLAKSVVDLATGEKEEPLVQFSKRNPHAVVLGRMGGLKGGKARAEKLSSERRSEIAKEAAKKRWGKKN